MVNPVTKVMYIQIGLEVGIDFLLPVPTRWTAIGKYIIVAFSDMREVGSFLR